MELILLILSVVLLGIIVVLLLTGKKSSGNDDAVRKLSEDIAKLDTQTRDEFRINRSEYQNSFRENRKELSESLKSFEEKFSDNVKDLNLRQKQNFDDFNQRQQTIKTETEAKLEQIRESVEKKLTSIQDSNEQKLEQMRKTVDEKLHETLEKRLSESFNQVSERLKQVHEGLGEMKNLATGVGDLKKVLSNVKTRGVLGEIQLGNILENILSPEQYSKNVAVKEGSRENVEYAIKMPGKDDAGKVVYLPIDSKFPIESYHLLLDAYEKGNPDTVKSASKVVENEIRRCAKDIHDKYISPPDTTDFGILFLPVEGLYAEVVRQTSLLEILQRDFKIVITGPTTLAALLNSLQMGFKTLAIEKRTSEVWRVLSAVKTEFGKFGEVLKNARDKINKAGEDIDKLVGTRTRMIQSKLRNITEMPDSDVNLLSDSSSTPETGDE